MDRTRISWNVVLFWPRNGRLDIASIHLLPVDKNQRNPNTRSKRFGKVGR